MSTEEMDPSPYTHAEHQWVTLQAQLLKQSKEVEELESMERQAFKLELKSESEALEEQFNARNNRLQCNQDNKLKALLARHTRELLDHSTETEEKIRQAKDEASKVKNDQQRCHKQREADLELKFQERRQQLKNKEEEADAEVARIALEAVKKQVALSTALGAAHLVSSLPPAEITPKSEANAPLSQLVDPGTGTAASPQTASSAELPAIISHERSGPDSTMTPHDAPDNANRFNLDRVCYPTTNNRYYFWMSTEDILPHQLRLENGIYIPYVDDSMGGSDYARWMFSPVRVIKIEYCDKDRLVKVILLHPGGDIGVQQTYILFGLRDGVEGFLTSFRKISPKTTIVEVERISLGPLPGH